MSVTLGGNVVIRDGDKLGYCWRECIKSLLPVCDIVSVCDGESTDGTQEEIREWLELEPKLSLCVWPWPNPKGRPEWFADWINYNREHTRADYQIQLDADEVLHENSFEELLRFKADTAPDKRVALVCHRFNFWRDPQSLIPHGYCCGHRVVRVAPQPMFLASDGYDARGADVPSISVPSEIQIMHYGFIRQREQFFAKEKLLQGYYFDTYDPRLEKAETHEGNWASMPGVTGWENDLLPFQGTHPQIAIPWLKAQGHEL
jgi:glycosyltransferase involved in cell wall biosynthesis